MIVDSGAGETFVTTEVYRALGSPSLNDTITVADVSNTVTTARIFGPLFAFVKKCSRRVGAGTLGAEGIHF